MLKLRKILLHDTLFYIIFTLVVILTIFRLSIVKKSIYNTNTKKVEGIVKDIHIIDDKVDITLKAKEDLIVTYYKKDKEQININLGDKILVIGEFTKPASPKSQYLFNYKKYLERKNIYFKVQATSIIKLKNNKNIFYEIKKIIIKRIPNRYLYTFILGDKKYLDKDVIRSYQENGISHLFAISGMHITLLTGMLSKLLKKMKVSEEQEYFIITIFLINYLIIVGITPSILRGILFYIFFTLNKLYYFYIKPVNIYLFIISLSLLVNPNYLFDIAFQYSYLISLSLISLSSTLQSNNYIKSLLKVSIISFIVSIPITIRNFYQINILSIIYNLFYVPLVSIVIFPMSLLVLVIPKLNIIYNIFIVILEKTSTFFSKINTLKLVFIKLPDIVYIIYLIVILIFIFSQKKKYLYILLILLTIHFSIPIISNNDYIDIIDVGQGDSILIHLNRKNILIDTGGDTSYSSNKDGEIFFNTIYPTLKSNGIKKLDYLILSHGDKDHMGEAKKIVESISVNKVIFNVGSYNYLEKDLIKTLKRKNIKYYKNIENIYIGNTPIYFLNTGIYNNENDNSNVLYFIVNNYKFLLMGDAGVDKEKDILDEYNLSDIDVLKVGHHGSDTSSSKEFIDIMNPKYSIISVGENNRYNHPKKSVLNTLSNSKIYRTDKDGSIEIKIKSAGYSIETCSS